MYVLGINAYHASASACLIRDGQLLAAAEEERFNRIKYCAGFPTQAIAWCLAEAAISAYQLVRDRLANAARVRDPKSALVEALGLDPSQLKATFHNVEHHIAHMASAFYV